MKKNILKIALMGLAIGSSVGGCGESRIGDAEQDSSSCSNKTSCQGKTSCTAQAGCKGTNGCTGKSDCTGSSGCKGTTGCTGKSDCTGTSNMSKNPSSDASSQMKQKREAAAKTMNVNKQK
jgi:hypothetical protein